tara:strand:+ start:266 stop:952 length:687 start_codon:yes stop_codon:yes gene_type:complete
MRVKFDSTANYQGLYVSAENEQESQLLHLFHFYVRDARLADNLKIDLHVNPPDPYQLTFVGHWPQNEQVAREDLSRDWYTKAEVKDLISQASLNALRQEDIKTHEKSHNHIGRSTIKGMIESAVMDTMELHLKKREHFTSAHIVATANAALNEHVDDFPHIGKIDIQRMIDSAIAKTTKMVADRINEVERIQGAPITGRIKHMIDSAFRSHKIRFEHKARKKRKSKKP